MAATTAAAIQSNKQEGETKAEEEETVFHKAPFTDSEDKSTKNNQCPFCRKSDDACLQRWCPVSYYCGNSRRSCILNSTDGFCKNCAVFLFSHRHKLKPVPFSHRYELEPEADAIAGQVKSKGSVAKKGKPELKRALSAYMFFVRENRQATKTANPDATFGELGKILGEKWNSMSAAEKQPFEEMHKQDKERYDRERKMVE